MGKSLNLGVNLRRNLAKNSRNFGLNLGRKFLVNLIKISVFGALFLGILPNLANAEILSQNSAFGEEKMRVLLKFDDKSVEFTLDDSEAAREFYEMLPLKVEFRDYAGAEKASNVLKSPLRAKGRADYEPQMGDLFYFAPWGNLGVFYEKQPPHSGLIYLGRMLNLGDLKHLKAKNANFKAQIQRLENAKN